MLPTIGRIVHFYDHSRPRDASGKPGPHAALVTAVGPDKETVSLTVFPDGYPPVAVGWVGYGEITSSYWVWPPRD